MHIFCGDSATTERLGRHLAGFLKPGDVITLNAPLGGGKTTLARGICGGLGLDEEDVSSPTFVIFHVHQARLPVYHFDLYRLHAPQELHPIGAEDYIWGDGVSLIEWPQIAHSLLPPDRLEIEIAYAGTPEAQGQAGRNLSLTGWGSWKERSREFHQSWEKTLAF